MGAEVFAKTKPGRTFSWSIRHEPDTKRFLTHTNAKIAGKKGFISVREGGRVALLTENLLINSGIVVTCHSGSTRESQNGGHQGSVD